MLPLVSLLSSSGEAEGVNSKGHVFHFPSLLVAVCTGWKQRWGQPRYCGSLWNTSLNHGILPFLSADRNKFVMADGQVSTVNHGGINCVLSTIEQQDRGTTESLTPTSEYIHRTICNHLQLKQGLRRKTMPGVGCTFAIPAFQLREAKGLLWGQGLPVLQSEL